MWIAIFISWFEKKSKIKEKTGIQTLKVNNKFFSQQRKIIDFFPFLSQSNSFSNLHV